METSSGSLLNRVIGVGTKIDKDTNKEVLVTELYPSYFNEVVKTFELFPVAKYFGLTPMDVMNMPVDQWYKIRKTAFTLPENKNTDVESELLKIMKAMVNLKQEVGE